MKIHSALNLLFAASLAAPGVVQGESLGRLFFSPAERQRIDREPGKAPPTTPAPPPQLDGIITRSEGPPILFLDGRAVPASPRQIHTQDGTVNLTTADGRIHRLQVGNPSFSTRP